MSTLNQFPESPLLRDDQPVDRATLHDLVQPFQVSCEASDASHAAPAADCDEAQSEASCEVASPADCSSHRTTEGPLTDATLHDRVQRFSADLAKLHDAGGAPPPPPDVPPASEPEGSGSFDHFLKRQADFVDEVEAMMYKQAGRQAPSAPHDANSSTGRAQSASHTPSEESFSPPPALSPDSFTSVDIANALIAAVARRWEEPPQVSEQQKTAIEMILCGQKQDEIAQTLGVHRSTLWRWRNQDPDFRRALTIARENAFRRSTEQLREFVPKALDIVLTQLQEGNYQAAVQVLRLVRIDRHEPTPAHPTRKLLGELRK